MGKRIYFVLMFIFVVSLFPPIQVYASSEEPPSPLFQKGVEALQKGDLREAEADFRAVLKKDPENPFAYFNLGGIFMITRRVDLALFVFNKAVELKPDFVAAHFRLAEIHERQGDLNEAAREIEEAYLYLTDEDSPEGKAVYIRLKELEETMEIRENWEIGIGSLRNGNYKVAEESFRAILVIRPRNAQAYNFLGVVLGIQNRFDEAIESFQESLRLKPDLTDSRTRLAELYQMKGAWVEARSELERALLFTEDPDGAEAESLEEKLNAIDDQIEIKTLIDRSDQAIGDKNIDAAIVNLQGVTQLDPKNRLIYFNLGNLWAQKSRFDLAESAFKKAIELEPNDTEAYLRLGQVYTLARLWGRAKTQYEKALMTPAGKAPPEREALQRLVSLADQGIGESEAAAQTAYDDSQKALRENDFDKAILLLERATFLHPEDSQLHIRLGELYERADKIDLAINEMRGALEFNPRLAAPHQHLAFLYEKRGYFYQALKELKEADALSPSSEERAHLDEAEKKVAEIEKETDSLIKNAKEAWDEGRRTAAIEALKKGLVSAPDDVHLRMAVGIFLAKTGAVAPASSEFNAILLLEPSSGEAHYRLGLLYASAGQGTEARREYEAALQSKTLPEEDRPNANLERMRAEAKLRNEQEARRHFNRGNRFISEQDYLAAAQAFERVVRLYPEDIATLYLLGSAYEGLGDQAAAIRYYTKVSMLNRNHIRARERLGFIHEREGEIEEAIQTYREALSLLGEQESPDTIWLKDRLAPLEKRLYISANQTVLNYNSNPSGSSRPRGDLSSSLSGTFTYYLRKDARFQLPIGLSSQSTFFYRSNTIVNNETLSVTAISLRSPYSYSLGYNSTFGIAGGGPTGIDQVGLLNVARRGGVPSSIGFDYSYDNFISFGNKNFNAIRQNVRVSVTQDWDQNSANASLRFLNNAARLSDQTSATIGMGLSYTRTFTESIRGSVSYNLDMIRFKNLDSLALARQQMVTRRNLLHTFSLSASYLIQGNLTLGVGYTEIRNDSSLPAQDNITIEQRLSGQASSLGDYRQRLINFNLGWAF